MTLKTGIYEDLIYQAIERKLHKSSKLHVLRLRLIGINKILKITMPKSSEG